MPSFFAYIDPFTGSLVFQLLAAGLMAFMLFFKKVKAFVLGFFGLGVIVDAESSDIPTVKFDNAEVTFENSDLNEKRAA